MTDYNFYSDHIEVVFDGDVILDSRKNNMRRILRELYYDFTIFQGLPTNRQSLECFTSILSIIATLCNSSNFDNSELSSIISNVFMLSRRRHFGQFHIHFITSK